MIDLHNHILPAVDDGASDPGETAAALGAFAAAGVRTVVATPHLRASLLDRPAIAAPVLDRLDQAYRVAAELAAAQEPPLRLERGVELLLDTPHPELSDPRVRLAGTSFVLLEFPFFAVPPNSTRVLHGLVEAGWTPVVAHPERYADFAGPDQAREWRDAGCFLQLNHGSLLGRFGTRPAELAWSLLEHGCADLLSSDYHARGRLATADAREAMAAAGADEAWDQLTRANPERLLLGLPPLRVPPVHRREPFWRSLLRWRR